ncbi:MAG: hypothetical protein IT444_12425 [Phycisphaeraceae bacterium]|nr:hypothetical protein [Phycisphaeraceae bacterium]
MQLPLRMALRATGCIRGLGEQLIRNIVGIVPAADGDAVADPLANRILREGHRPFFFAGLAKGLPQAFPRLHAGSLPDGPNLSNDCPLAVDRDKMLLVFLGLGEAVLQ